MKKLFLLIMVFMLMCLFSFSQSTDTTVKTSAKPSQSMFRNEIYVGYGAQSIFYLTGRFVAKNDLIQQTNLRDNKSAGTFIIGYSRSLCNVVSTGIMFGYQNIHNTGLVYSKHLTIDDILITGSIRINFRYLHKPFISMYSGVGLTLTRHFGILNINGEKLFENELWVGGELTLIGLRFGHALGGFIEAGFGTNGLLNAGLSYKFTKSKSFIKDTTIVNKPNKTNSVPYNDFFFGYGILSFFYSTGHFTHYNSLVDYSKLSVPRSAGTVFIGYSRSFTRVVSLGLLLGYQSFLMTGSRNKSSSGTDSVKVYDRLITGIGRFTFCFVKKPIIQLYSGIGVGLTVDVAKIYIPEKQPSEHKLFWAGQITLLGLRFGRAFGGFLELGYGSLGIVNAGLSYKFKD